MTSAMLPQDREPENPGSLKKDADTPLSDRRRRNRHLSAFLAALVLVVAMPARAQESWGVGQITAYHLNSLVSGRGPCVQMTPALPDAPWACLWQSNPLYKVLTVLLMTAYQTGRNCTMLLLNPKDSTGAWRVQVVECR